MFRLKNKLNSGITILELLVSLSIFFVLLVISTSNWSLFTKNQALSKDKLGIIAMFEQARGMAVASKANTTFGVNISTTTITLFQGSVFSQSDSNNIYYNLNSLIQVSSTTLVGGGKNILFERLSGNTSSSGTIKISAVSDPTSSTTITIFESGVVQ